DDDTGVGTGGTGVTVNNVAPAAKSMGGAAPGEEGATYALTGTFSEPGGLDRQAVVISWGPGEGTTTLNLAAGLTTFTASHQYLDDNPSGTPSDLYPVTVSVTDDDTGVGTGAAAVTVNNVAPVANPIGGPTLGVRGQSLDFSGSFSDVGTLDTHKVRWDFGDGTVIDYRPSTDAGALAPSHTYIAN